MKNHEWSHTASEWEPLSACKAHIWTLESSNSTTKTSLRLVLTLWAHDWMAIQKGNIWYIFWFKKKKKKKKSVLLCLDQIGFVNLFILLVQCLFKICYSQTYLYPTLDQTAGRTTHKRSLKINCEYIFKKENVFFFFFFFYTNFTQNTQVPWRCASECIG